MGRTKYNCVECPGYCCSVYGTVTLSKFDAKRLAKHLGVTVKRLLTKYTKKGEDGPSLIQSKDPLMGKSCVFLDKETRGCTVYHGRPNICRKFPYESHCGYWDLLDFERKHQGEPDLIPLVQLEY